MKNGIDPESNIKIGAAVLRVVRIFEEKNSMQITVSGEKFKIHSESSIEILPGVFVMVGLDPLDGRPKSPVSRSPRLDRNLLRG